MTDASAYSDASAYPDFVTLAYRPLDGMARATSLNTRDSGFAFREKRLKPRSRHMLTTDNHVDPRSWVICSCIQAGPIIGPIRHVYVAPVGNSAFVCACFTVFERVCKDRDRLISQRAPPSCTCAPLLSKALARQSPAQCHLQKQS